MLGLRNHKRTRSFRPAPVIMKVDQMAAHLVLKLVFRPRATTLPASSFSAVGLRNRIRQLAETPCSLTVNRRLQSKVGKVRSLAGRVVFWLTVVLTAAHDALVNRRRNAHLLPAFTHRVVGAAQRCLDG